MPLSKETGVRLLCAKHDGSKGVKCSYRLSHECILAVLSVGTRHHKPPLRGGCASGRRGRGATRDTHTARVIALPLVESFENADWR